MPCIQYIDKTFHKSSLIIIAQANKIIQKWMDDGYKLTLRQLYYQFVGKALIPDGLCRSHMIRLTVDSLIRDQPDLTVIIRMHQAG